MNSLYDKDIGDAIAMLLEALGNAKPHRDGQPAVLHSLRVGLAQKTKEGMILGFLHDVPEDAGSKWLVRIRDRFGDRMHYLVAICTRMGDESYEEFGARIIASGEVVCMKKKMTDIEDNMHPSRSDEKARQKAVAYGRLYDALQDELRRRGCL